MFRYQILIEYVGSSFIGWQVQTKGKTIQGLIQKKISYLLNEKIKLIGSGRTDTGVHAIEQSAHFEVTEKIQYLNKFLKSINYFLNKYEIAILKKKRKNISLGIVVAYGQILKKDILEIPKYGWINIHYSLLPKLRGAAPIQRAIMNNETSTGISIMKIDEGLDSGPVCNQYSINIL